MRLTYIGVLSFSLIASRASVTTIDFTKLEIDPTNSFT
jgi:hypothetical protein